MHTQTTRKSITDMMDLEEIKIKEILQIYLCKTNPLQIGVLGEREREFLLNIFCIFIGQYMQRDTISRYSMQSFTSPVVSL